MYTKKGKKLAELLTTLMIPIMILSLTACAQATPTSAPATQPTESTVQEPVAAVDPLNAATYEDWVKAKGVSDESFTLSVLSPYDPYGGVIGEKNYVECIIKEFNKLYPKVKVDYEVAGWDEIDAKITNYELAGTPLDVALNWDGATASLAQQGIVLPLDGKMPKWAVDNMLPALITPPFNATFKGKLYMWSEHFNANYISVRLDLLQQAGVDPANIKSQADLLAALDAVSKKTVMTKPLAYMLGGSSATMDQSIWWFYGNSLESMADFSNKDAWIDSARFVQKLLAYVPESALAWKYPEAERAYATGSTGFLPHGSWLIGANIYDKTGIFTPEKTVVIPMPFGPYATDKTPFYVPTSNGYYLMKTSEHPQEALDFMAVAAIPACTLFYARHAIPSLSNWTFADKLKAWPDANTIQWWFTEWDNIKTNRAYIAPGMLARGELEQRWYEMVIDLYNGSTTPEKMYDDFYAFAEPILKELETK